MKKILMILALMCLTDMAAAQGVVDQFEDEGGFVAAPAAPPSVEAERQIEKDAVPDTKKFKPLGVENGEGDGPTVYKFRGVDEIENPITTVAETKELRNSAKVVMEGEIIRHISAEMYEFRDKTGVMIVRINKENWKDVDWDGFKTYPAKTVRIEGWINRGFVDGARIDVDAVKGIE